MDFRRIRVAELGRRVAAGELSAREVTAHALGRIEVMNPSVNAFVAVDGTRAMEQAAAVDQLVAPGTDPGPLAGVPVGVKDSEDAAGYRSTEGSALLEHAPVATTDSVHVARLRAAGAVVVGKTNMPEFAWSSHTANALFGTTKNPWHLDHSAGGSSGGSAAAVAAGMVPLATGSDGGGSIRIPSACCGLSGMKASLGRVPSGGRRGEGWLDLSTPGPIARRVADLVCTLEVVVGPDPSDLRSLPMPDTPWHHALSDPKVPAKVGWCPGLGFAEVDAGVLSVCERALGALDDLGVEVVEVASIFDEDPFDDWLTIVAACLRRTVLALEDSENWDRMDRVLARIVERGRSVTGVELVKALDRCHAMNLALVDLFHDVRLLVTPTTAGAAPPNALGGRGVVNGQVVNNWVSLTYPFNMTRSPAATVCAGLHDDGVPVGVQLVGPAHADLAVLRSAAALEAAIGFDEVAPIAG